MDAYEQIISFLEKKENNRQQVELWEDTSYVNLMQLLKSGQEYKDLYKDYSSSNQFKGEIENRISANRNIKDLISYLEKEMKKAADDLRFEDAAFLRDKIRDLKIKTNQKLVENAIILMLSLCHDMPPDRFNSIGKDIKQLDEEERDDLVETLKKEFSLLR